MKKLTKLAWFIISVVLLLAVLATVLLWYPALTDRRGLEETREMLRKEGFKMDLADFSDLPGAIRPSQTGPLAGLNPSSPSNPVSQRQSLLPATGANIAIPIWKYKWLDRSMENFTWQQFAGGARMLRPDLNRVTEWILATPEPIRFHLTMRGYDLLLPHLADIRNVSTLLANEILVNLHDEDHAAAWTNLLAQTQFIKKWEPEPLEISHQIRFLLLNLAAETVWQALQTNCWSDAQLAKLQSEWESMATMSGLPQVMAFQRVSMANLFRRTRADWEDVKIADVCKEIVRDPKDAFPMVKVYWSEFTYRLSGSFKDERKMLLYFRDRELEYRTAICASNWLQMASLPGVASHPAAPAGLHQRIQSILDLPSMGAAAGSGGAKTLLGRAAESEARRRVVATALALERFRIKHGEYPENLSRLEPDFFQSVPSDFIDGKPLRYERRADGRFLLYSIGLDGSDNHGQLPGSASRNNRSRIHFPIRSARSSPASDIVWPLAATAAEMAAHSNFLHEENLREFIAESEEQSVRHWEENARHQQTAEGILQNKAEMPQSGLIDGGKPLADLLRNTNDLSALNLAITELFSLKPVVTGGEPELVTYELPINAQTLNTIGSVQLLIDSENFDSFGYFFDPVVTQERASNGNLRLVLNTIFETSGKHAVCLTFEPHDGIPGVLTRDLVLLGPATELICSNLCQFGSASTSFDTTYGAPLHFRLDEPVANYKLRLYSTNRELLKTFTGSTSNGVVMLHWDLHTDAGRRWTGNVFSSELELNFPASGRTHKLKGP